MNYFELYPGDYLRDTSRLALVDHGAYLRLMMAYYGEEQPLPAEYAELYVIVAAVNAADKVAVRKVADRYFPIADDGLRHNSRADEEIAKAQKRIQTARENGAKNKAKSNPPDKPAGIPSGSQRDTRRDTHSGEALHMPHATFLHEGSVATPAAPAVALEGVFEGHANPQATPNPAAPFAIALNTAGFRCTPINPELVAFVAEGGTVEHLRAITAWPECKGKPAAYVLSIARRELAEPAKPTGESHATPRKLSASEQVRAAVAGRRGRPTTADAAG